MKRTEGKAQAGGSKLNQVKAKVPIAYEVELHRLVEQQAYFRACLLYTSPSPRDRTRSRMPSSA